MALGALTLSTTAGVQGRPFASAISGLTTGRVEVLQDGSPGFYVANGMLRSSSLPYPVSTAVLREYEPGAGDGYRDTRINITATTATEVSAIALQVGVGMDILSVAVGGEESADGSLLYEIQVQNELGASIRIPVSRPFGLAQDALPSDLTFTRSGTELYRDSSGLFASASANTPALTHGYSSGWVPTGIYHTPELTNLALYAFDVGTEWIAQSSTTSSAAPTIGLLDDGLVIASAGSTAARYQQQVTKGTTLTAGTTYLVECWFKFGTSGKARLYATNAGGTQSYIAVTTSGYSDRVVSAGTVTFVDMEDMGDGLMRCWFTFVPGSTGEHRIGIGPNSNVSGQTVIAYGCNVVAGSLPPGQPILTTGSTATKPASSLVATGPVSDGVPYTVRMTLGDGSTQDRNIIADAGSITIPNDNDHPVIGRIEILPVQPPEWEAISGTTTDIVDAYTGLTWQTQSPGKSWSLKRATNRELMTLLFEVRPGDQWPGDLPGAKERCEIRLKRGIGQSLDLFPFDTDVWIERYVAVQWDDNPVTFDRNLVMGQLHNTEDAGDTGAYPPNVDLRLGSDGIWRISTAHETAATNPTPPDEVERATLDVPATPLNSSFRLIHQVIKTNSSQSGGGSLGFWQDGVEIFNDDIPMGYNDTLGPYWKDGLYLSNGPGASIRKMMLIVCALTTDDLTDRITNPTPIY